LDFFMELLDIRTLRAQLREATKDNLKLAAEGLLV